MKTYYKYAAVFALLAAAAAAAIVAGCAGSAPPSRAAAASGGTKTSGPYETVDLRVGASVSDETIANIYNKLSERLREGLRVALIPVYPGPGVDTLTAAYITEQLDIKFDDAGKYNILTRANIDLAVREQNFQAQYVDNSTAVRFGKLLGADVIIIGTVDGERMNKRMVMRALEVNTGRILTMIVEPILIKAEAGFSEIVLSMDNRHPIFWLMGNGLRTARTTFQRGETVTFKVPNGYWEVWTAVSDDRAPPFSSELNDTRLFINAPYRGGGYDRIEVVRRESIVGSADVADGRAANARAAAQSLAGGLAGKVRANAGTAFFPLTVKGISADDGNFLFDVMSVELVNSGRFAIIEKQKLLALLGEYDFQMSGMVGVRTIGQLLGADVVIFGIGGERNIELAAVDVAKFTILAQVSHKF